MKNNRVIITYIDYLDKQYLSLFYVDSNDRPIEILELSSIRIGEIIEAKVIKKLKNNDGICLLADSSKAYIKSMDGLNEQDIFIAKIIADAHDNKDAVIIKHESQDKTFCKYTNILDHMEYSEVVTDIPVIYDELLLSGINVRLYEDEDYMLKDMYHLNKHLLDALNPRVLLKNGSNIVIEATEALTVVDVNSAQSGRMKATNFALEINKACCVEIIKQLRLRSIGGIVVVDFLKMNSKQDEQDLITYIKEQCNALDSNSVKVHDITALGLLEMTRTRTYKQLSQQFI